MSDEPKTTKAKKFVHITFKTGYLVTKVTGKGEKGYESEVIPAGRHRFEYGDNPFVFLSGAPRHRDPRYHNRWLMKEGTNSGLAAEAWALRAKKDKDEKGEPKFVIEQ